MEKAIIHLKNLRKTRCGIVLNSNIKSSTGANITCKRCIEQIKKLQNAGFLWGKSWDKFKK
jgi:hypothetical protein